MKPDPAALLLFSQHVVASVIGYRLSVAANGRGMAVTDFYSWWKRLRGLMLHVEQHRRRQQDQEEDHGLRC